MIPLRLSHTITRCAIMITDCIMINSNSDSGLTESDNTVVLGHPDILILDAIAYLLTNRSFNIVGRATTDFRLKELAFEHKPSIILFDPVVCEHYLLTISTFRQGLPDSVVALISKRGTFSR